MSEKQGPIDLDEEIKRAELAAAQADWAHMEEAAKKLADLRIQRVNLRRNMDSMRERMRKAGDEAEAAGTGYEGKGMPTQDKND